MNQQVFFMSDGEKELQRLQVYLSPRAKHILGWFHVTMRITVLRQFAKGLIQLDEQIGGDIDHALERMKWYLWHGKVVAALDRWDDAQDLIWNFEETHPKFQALQKALAEFKVYIERNAWMIPNYGQLWREGKVISTAFIESLVNSLLGKRFTKKQQMQWTHAGAHLLLQTRTRVINGELPATFRKWYPTFAAANELYAPPRRSPPAIFPRFLMLSKAREASGAQHAAEVARLSAAVGSERERQEERVEQLRGEIERVKTNWPRSRLKQRPRSKFMRNSGNRPERNFTGRGSDSCNLRPIASRRARTPAQYAKRPRSYAGRWRRCKPKSPSSRGLSLSDRGAEPAGGGKAGLRGGARRGPIRSGAAGPEVELLGYPTLPAAWIASTTIRQPSLVRRIV